MHIGKGCRRCCSGTVLGYFVGGIAPLSNMFFIFYANISRDCMAGPNMRPLLNAPLSEPCNTLPFCISMR